MNINYSRVVEMTDEEKFSMYMKLTKKEIVRMHIELEKFFGLIAIAQNKPNTWPDGYPTYNQITTHWPPVDQRYTVASTDGKPINMQH